MISTAFPEYDQTTLPAIPATWVDTSWRNDVCPSWQFGEYQIFIDHANPTERETGGERYFVNDVESGDCFLVSDDWGDVLEYVAGIENKRIGLNCRDRQSAERQVVCKFDYNPKIEPIDGGYRVTWELKRLEVMK